MSNAGRRAIIVSLWQRQINAALYSATIGRPVCSIDPRVRRLWRTLNSLITRAAGRNLATAERVAEAGNQ